jgi:GNAT superfamily N-acetyltransferase
MAYIKTFEIFNSTKYYLVENIEYIKDGNKLLYELNNNLIGYIEYQYDGTTFSEHIPSNEKEFYIEMIEVYKEFRGNVYASEMINHIKKYAKKLGATIITLRVDNGLGFTKRTSDMGLEKLYLKNGFKYSHTEEEVKLDDTKNLGAMYYKFE